jgi:hypothetical protein
MHTITHEPVAGTGAAIVPFPIPDDDIIPVITGVTLVDADPNVIARRLGPKNWKARTLFFHNIIAGSVDNVGKMIGAAKTQDDGAYFLDWSMCEMSRRIGEVLDLWGETEPANKDAAALFLLSLKPEHRRAACMFISSRRPKYRATVREVTEFVDGYMQKTWQNLAIFYRMTIMGNPAENAAWLAGPQECRDGWYDLSKVPGAADGHDDAA